MKRMKHVLKQALVGTALLTVASFAQAQNEQIITQKSGVVSCKNDAAAVSVRNAELIFTGHCTVLNLMRPGTTAAVESADVVILSSRNLNVTVHGNVDEVTFITAAGSRFFGKNIGTMGVLSSDIHA